MIPAPAVKDDRSSGFTLIEILVAMALLAIVFVAVFSLFSQTIHTEEATRFHTVAPMLAQKKMAEAVTDLSSGRFHSSGEFEHYPGYRWETNITESAAEVPGSSGDTMKQIDVAVMSVEDNRRFQLRRYELSR